MGVSKHWKRYGRDFPRLGKTTIPVSNAWKLRRAECAAENFLRSYSHGAASSICWPTLPVSSAALMESARAGAKREGKKHEHTTGSASAYFAT